MLALLGVVASAPACAAKKDSEPPVVPLDVEFPSEQAAIVTDGVIIFVFDGALACGDLLRLRQTQQRLPDARVQTPSIAPCQLQSGGAAVDLPLGADYTMLAVGQLAGKDLFAGCVVQKAYGSTLALPLSLAFIDDNQKLGTTTCAKLSDKCNTSCR